MQQASRRISRANCSAVRRERASVKGRTRVASTAGAGEELELAGERGDERVRGVGAEDADGVRIEGDGERFAASPEEDRARARALTWSMTQRWPRCTPSKLPMVATVGPKLARSWREWKVIMSDELVVCSCRLDVLDPRRLGPIQLPMSKVSWRPS